MVCAQSLSLKKKTKRFLVLLGLVIPISCGQADPSIPVPPSTSLPQPSTTTTMEPEVTTTTTMEPPAVPIPVTEPERVEDPILCSRYSHPLHHLSCEEAAAQKDRSRATSTPTVTTTPSSGLPRTASVASLPDLPACIAKYESTSGQLDSNIYQFQLPTWQTYGGEGRPEDAKISRQTEVFWKAWADDGPHHWAAQKGRCF